MKLLIDTDIGSDIDDALALLLLLHMAEVDILGVTTTYGCVDVRAKIAKKIINARGLNVPVFAGSAQPLSRWPQVWHTGTEGKGILDDDESRADLTDLGIGTRANEFIADTVVRNPGEVTLVALGPLTNVAMAIRENPQVAEKAKAIYFMGCGVTFPARAPENLQQGTKYRSEPSHNVWADLRAAREVFESEARISAVTNDVTTQVWWDGSSVRALTDSDGPPEAVLVGSMLKVWLEHRSESFNKPITGTCPHDALAAAEACGRGFVRYESGLMHIDCNRYTTFTPDPSGRHRAGACVDAERFLEWFPHALLGPLR
ncbi:MAG: nucleoside hydrolase [Armatimonadota bacterium]|nr:nucleoside hydrolase [Armatimonadota bacterium]